MLQPFLSRNWAFQKKVGRPSFNYFFADDALKYIKNLWLSWACVRHVRGFFRRSEYNIHQTQEQVTSRSLFLQPTLRCPRSNDIKKAHARKLWKGMNMDMPNHKRKTVELCIVPFLLCCKFFFFIFEQEKPSHNISSACHENLWKLLSSRSGLLEWEDSPIIFEM